MAIASEISGFPGVTFNTASRMMTKPARLAMTAPYPTSEAVLKSGNMKPKTPLLTVARKLAQCPKREITKVVQATTKEMINAHNPEILEGSRSGKRVEIKL